MQCVYLVPHQLTSSVFSMDTLQFQNMIVKLEEVPWVVTHCKLEEVYFSRCLVLESRSNMQAKAKRIYTKVRKEGCSSNAMSNVNYI